MKTILIVDDEPDVLTILGLLLGAEGYHVRTAADGQEALEQITQSAPSLIITDLMMPKMDGVELCHHIRAKHGTTVPVILATASAVLSEEQQCAFDLVMRKPMDFRVLLEQVRRMVGPPR